MKIKTKLTLISAAALLVVGTLAGFATHALFSSTQTNQGNSATVGDLKISSLRDDVPNVGPMFYSDTAGQPGTVPTGVWAPGDNNTRGLFLSNTGSLDARLTTITVQSADSNGAPTTIGADYTADMAFANQANVLIWQLGWYDTSNSPLPMGSLSGSELNAVMQIVSDAYTDWAAGNPNADPAQLPDGDLVLMQAVNQQLLREISTIRGGMTDPTGMYQDATLQVTRVQDMPMSNLVNHNVDVSSLGITTVPGEAQLLAFTVELDKNAGNETAGISSYFNFNTYWEQVKNN